MWLAAVGGVVVVTVEYRIRLEDSAPFESAMRALQSSRQRNGAYGWRLHRDLEIPERYVEYFLEPSWVDHLTHHDRVVGTDKSARGAAHMYHQGTETARVSHLRLAS